MVVIALEAPSDTKSNFYLMKVRITSAESFRGYKVEGKNIKA